MGKNITCKPSLENRVRILEPFVGRDIGERLAGQFNGFSEMAEANDALLRSTVPEITDQEITLLRGIFEVGSAMNAESAPNRLGLKTGEDIVDLLRHNYDLSDVAEQYWVIALDKDRQMVSVDCVANGEDYEIPAPEDHLRLIVNPDDIFKLAAETNAHEVVIVHNLPLQLPEVNWDECRVRNKIEKASKKFKIPILDNIVLGRNPKDRLPEYISMREKDIIGGWRAPKV